MSSRKVRFLGYGIDVETLKWTPLAINQDHFTISQVGRITPRKHCDVLIEVLPRFAESKKKFTVSLVGATAALEDELYLKTLKRTTMLQLL